MRSVYIAAMLIFICQCIFGQNDSIRMHIIGRSELDGVRLRWAIKDPNLLFGGLKSGYQVKRAIYDKSKKNDDQEYVLLQQNPFKKAPDKQWNEYISKYPIKNDVIRETYTQMAFDLSNMSLELKGGEKIDEIIKLKREIENQRTYILLAAEMSWDAANLLGLGTLDTDVKLNQTYIYQISLISDPTIFSYQIIEHNNKNINEKKDFKVLEQDKKLVLTWNKSKLLNGIFVDISLDNKKFTRYKNVPSFKIYTGESSLDTIDSYVVDSLTNYKMYYFNVYSSTSFGDEILIGQAKGMPRDKTAPKRPLMKVAKHIEPNKVEISWDMSTPLESDIAGFIVGRSTQDDSDYYAIHDGLIHKDRRRFEDIYFSKDSSNYYIVEVVDTSGNRSRSDFSYLTLIDTVPPVIPICIKSKMDSIGVVTLNLEPQSEKDFMGYRIYKANAEYHEFSVVQETYNDTIVSIARNPIIVDSSTVKSLTKYVYYKVTALDYHYNESKPSQIIKVKRPDIYPPVPPLIKDFLVTDQSIKLEIVNSTSSDVVKQYVLRKKSEDSLWIILDSISLDKSVYLDRTGASDIYYDYALMAKDDSELLSPLSNILKLKKYFISKSADIEITCQTNKKSNKLNINWKVKEPNIPNNSQLQVFDLTSGSSLIYQNEYLQNGSAEFHYNIEITKIGIKLITPNFDYLITESNQCKIIKE